MNMNAGRELNVKIATDVMEWHYWDFEGDYEGEFPMFTYVGESALAVYFDQGDQHIWFDPSTDISAAWAVVEKVLEIEYMCFSLSKTPVTYWVAEFHQRGTVYQDFGDTPAEAICLAALKAVDSEQDDKPDYY